MSNLLKKLIFSFVASLVVMFSLVPLVEAQDDPPTPNTAGKNDTWYNSGFKTWYAKVYDPSNPSEIFGERYTAAQVQWVFYGTLAFIINQAVGPENAPTTQCFLNNFEDLSSCKGLLDNLLTTGPL